MKKENDIKRRIRKIYYDLRVKFFYKLLRRVNSPNFPKNPDGKVLVHIGCGEQDDHRYINVDERPFPHVHYVSSVFEIDKIFKTHSVDLFYLCHILEHVSHQKLSDVIEKLYRCLKPDGLLRISVPNFDSMIEIYKEELSISSIVNPLMGGQDYSENFHHSLFNKSYLSGLMRKVGFKEVREWDANSAPFHNFDDWSNRKYFAVDRAWDISLNLEGVK